tara:strand:+ start:259 stop:420 length:162 start_codon:yes stop_codon:yes gene_type:complete
MSKKAIQTRQPSKYGKKSSHTGALPLVESLIDSSIMVRPKVRQAQENRKSKTK